MDKPSKINDDITTGPQPSEHELERLKKLGFKSVVNFRTEGEKEQPLSPRAEGEKVRALGMKYLHLPIPMGGIRPEYADEFREQVASLPKPLFTHCMGGRRASVLSMIHAALDEGLSGDEAIKRANDKGLDIDKPELVKFVKEYVDEHSGVGKKTK